MKTMTCAQLSGPCDAKISGATKDELIANGMKHLDEAHPEMAAEIRATPMDDPKMVAWSQKFEADYAATEETA